MKSKSKAKKNKKMNEENKKSNIPEKFKDKNSGDGDTSKYDGIGP